MKFIFSIVAAFVFVSGFAQKAAKFKIDENSTVKDTTGFVYPANIWQPLISKGSHILKPEDPSNPNTAFYIVLAAEEDKAKRFAKMARPPESRSFKTGELIRFPQLKDIDGKEYTEKDLKGKIVVLNFWFINCKPCRMEIPDLNELVAKYSKKENLVFIAIALDRKAEIERFLDLYPFAYSIVDDGVPVAQKFGVQTYPTHAVIDTDGKVYFQTTGLAENTIYWLKKSIEELLAKSAKEVAGK